MRGLLLIHYFAVGFCVEEQAISQFSAAGDERYSPGRRAELIGPDAAPLAAEAGTIIFGDPEVGVMAAGYLGLALLALSFVAVGLFTSSLTQNQIVAAISSFGMLILLYVISWPAEAGGGILSSVLTYLSLPAHFSTMTRGVVDTSDIVFFLSVIVLALFLTQRSVESARWR